MPFLAALLESNRLPAASMQWSQGTPPVVHYQAQSPFFWRFPQEIRDNIYAIFFNSMRLSFGVRSVNRYEAIIVKPCPNSLALLRTCRRASWEIGETWIPRVLFNYEDPKTMLDRLNGAPPGTINKIRHMRVVGDTLKVTFEDFQREFNLACLLRHLPGLQLDTLTVLGHRVRQLSYDTMNDLIRDGNGWKELRYLSHDSGMLGFSRMHEFAAILAQPEEDLLERRRYWRYAQPVRWRHVMQQRDGHGSQTSVDIYRSRVARPGVILDESMREPFEQKWPEDKEGQDAYGIKVEKELMAKGEIGKELMIVAKRGVDANWEQSEDSDYLEATFYDEMVGFIWEEFRIMCDFPWYRFDNVPQEQIDEYDDPEELVWPPYHLKHW